MEGNAKETQQAHDILQTLEQLNVHLPASLASKVSADNSISGMKPMERFFSEEAGTVEKLSML